MNRRKGVNIMGNTHSRKKLDLTGQTFGRLTALGPAGKVGGCTAWLCRCECGNEVTVRTGSLRSGNTRSCGCLLDDRIRESRPDLTGRTFGHLTVLGPAGNVNGRTAWRCRCGCGSETVALTGNLRSGNTRSCGCLQGNRIRKRQGALDGAAECEV